MKVIFMGTPDFSVGTLEKLLEAGHEIALVVTQPDKPKGRGKSMQFPPVKEAALAHDLEVYQPRRVRDPECVEYLRQKAADIIVVVAFGQILPKEILEMPPYGCVNVHASLLPKYRGAAPIQWAVIQGEKVTGVTTMRMDEGLDTGDMILKEEVVLREDETGGSLFDRLAKTGAELCVKTLDGIVQGTVAYTPQNEKEATHTSMIKKQLGEIQWNRPAQELERLIRGLNPWPSAYTHLEGKTLKIWKSHVLDSAGEPGESCIEENIQEPGQVINITRDAIEVQTGQGILVLEEVQLEGKKRMKTDAFLRGCSLETGMRLGN
ncbi:MAG: methionyl-tRNA formyltransferase [Lachnospiraceae bacterium]|nr:methionyl-tRNA formyltransferase [Lachnospiraceae bacterium]